MGKMSKCILCGEEYEVCKMCEQVITYTPWRIECDTPRHAQLLYLVREIRKGSFTKKEAAEMIEAQHLTKEEVLQFVPSIQKTLMPFFEEENKKAEVLKEQKKEKIKPQHGKPRK